MDDGGRENEGVSDKDKRRKKISSRAKLYVAHRPL